MTIYLTEDEYARATKRAPRVTLTPQQADVLTVMMVWRTVNGRLPTTKELARSMNTSQRIMAAWVQELVDLGALERKVGDERS